MDDSQLRNLHPDSGSQQASVNETVLDSHPTSCRALPAYSIQAQASGQPTTATDFNNHSLEDGESGYVSHGHTVGESIFLRHCGSLTFRVSGIYASSVDDSFRFANSRGQGTRRMERVR